MEKCLQNAHPHTDILSDALRSGADSFTSSIDMHTHTNVSDGSDSPSELVRHACACGIKTLAITDHDTVDGIDEATMENERLGNPLRIIPGIEFSTIWSGEEIHVLGYLINKDEKAFTDRLVELRNRRNARNLRMIERMNQDGLPITLEELEKNHSCPSGSSKDPAQSLSCPSDTSAELVKNSSGTSITRAHFAKWLLSHGYVESIDEAFEKFLGHGKLYYVPRALISPMEAVRIIRENGGLAFLAHPGQYDLKAEELEELITLAEKEGLYGIEVYHNSHTQEQIQCFLALAEKYHLEISCGSDYHGLNKPHVFLGQFHGNPEIAWL